MYFRRKGVLIKAILDIALQNFELNIRILSKSFGLIMFKCFVFLSNFTQIFTFILISLEYTLKNFPVSTSIRKFFLEYLK